METKNSMEEIHSTIPVPTRKARFLKKMFAFSGPGALVAVGYMDPGNWITSIQGGAQYGYLLISVILMSSLIAMLLQVMCAKLGIVTGMDLAQATKALVGQRTAIVLWLTTELAIIATEIAEIIGSAIALNLLFNIPLLLGVVITIIDVLILLTLIKFSLRKIEAIVFCLIITIFIIFSYEVALTNPNLVLIIRSFIPNTEIFTAQVSGGDSAFFIALGIVGATVMPHNLYLHSSIVQSRQYVRTDKKALEEAIRYATIDSNMQLGFSFIINCLLLILGASLFFGKNPEDIGRFAQLYNALQDPNMAGAIASSTLATLFAIALLASGQNATITGTLTSQIVMEGFLNFTLPLWQRRIINRLIAIIPIISCIYLWGETGNVIEKLLVYTQVFLSIALPISMVPLLYLTSSRKKMGIFVNCKIFIIIGWLANTILIALNIQLVIKTINMLIG
ncbi:Nramp family divalent metal transporter [Candidatus Palibaumannia cicadellinicola]|uniref:Divalent metal cation transporter MntH n=1 Tax=Baumannia cicadellinicola subsp. Homalodisca coagulata TaxID=374463 RepID=Q1LTF4_BAUCH|nr:Nramp family divalent metal transporter [Candidatus Baumannia cicadellinicola]ABF13960.1 Mn2+/Fe2+ transporter, NRAMP family [Baumannia cicadellinicola str. Hc (Homalodisca coagulata)]MBS0032741.1 Nramp family divalent metal transporter [Candidatus Baumannia cicadellinicola]MCJ7462257.1 Nramp family divalent metal transporter [Candidatus Baumannia cicadellinicola]MCJ7462525.1 Nramp family divalent metal transporter [Candidatus Baumannia cicadellinicola]